MCGCYLWDGESFPVTAEFVNSLRFAGTEIEGDAPPDYELHIDKIFSED